MTFQIVHHMAALDGFPNPPNSLASVEACLEADAAVIEVDITPLGGDDFLLVHDPDLESETTGSGRVGECVPEQAKNFKLKYRGEATEHPPALLSEVVAAFLAQGRQTRLQLDYKSVLPSTSDEPLRRVTRLIEPLGDRVIISSGADWHLRKLRRLASWLDLGFDIGFYLDWRDPSWIVDPRSPPYLLGAYGYYDDHVLAKMALLPHAMYLEERCEILLGQLPDTSTWYVSHHVIARGLDDGFNMAAWLHDHGVRLDAWTLDTDKPAAVTNAPRLRDAGVDLFTTNTPAGMASLLNGGN